MRRTLAGLALFGAGLVVGIQVDVQLATVSLWDRAANRSDGTGRAFGNDVQDVIGPEIARLIECNNRWGNPYCLDEEAPPVP